MLETYGIKILQDPNNYQLINSKNFYCQFAMYQAFVKKLTKYVAVILQNG